MAQVAACSQTNTKHTNIERKLLNVKLLVHQSRNQQNLKG
jgi:hypothetical protein